MAKAGKKISRDLSTEEKIKKAALTLFTRKGYAATRTRDISAEAGINLALLNYYFRSKEKLFDLVMMEILFNFFNGIGEIFNDETTSLDEKIQSFVARYTVLLKQQPELPLFIFHEIRMHPDKLVSKTGIWHIFSSYFFKQLKDAMDKKKIAAIHPFHYVMNMIGMCVFPFIAAPLFKHIGGFSEKKYGDLMDERIDLIPEWMHATMRRK